MAVAYQGAISRPQGVEPSHGLETPAARMQAFAPRLEGARARGMADAFEMAGQAAILLGGAGDVLHVGRAAEALLGQGLRLKEGRLVPRGHAAAMFGARLEAALAGSNKGNQEAMTLPADGGGAMRVRILPFEDGQANPAQLLKAVVLLDRVL